MKFTNDTIDGDVQAWFDSRPPLIQGAMYIWPPGRYLINGDGPWYCHGYHELEGGTVAPSFSRLNPQDNWDDFVNDKNLFYLFDASQFDVQLEESFILFEKSEH